MSHSDDEKDSVPATDELMSDEQTEPSIGDRIKDLELAEKVCLFISTWLIQSVMLLLREAGLALDALANAGGGDEETRRQGFKEHTASFMSLLEFVTVNLQRQIRELDADPSVAPSTLRVKSDYVGRKKREELVEEAASILKSNFLS